MGTLSWSSGSCGKPVVNISKNKDSKNESILEVWFRETGTTRE